MQATTRVKLFLKHNTPAPVFGAIRYIADRTILKIIPLFFKYRINSFREKVVKEVTYGNKKFKIVIDPKNGYLDAQIYADGLYEPHIVSEIVKHVPVGGVCIDVGANIGHHTIIMSQCVGEKGKVFSYEPIPRIREQLKESLSLNKIENVIVISEALSDEEKEMELYVGGNNIGASSLIGNENDEKINVSVRTLNSYKYEKVDLIKIDVEGYEYHVLMGAEQLISSCKPTVIFEWSPIYYRIHNESHGRKIIEFFKERGYRLIDIENNNKPVEDFDTFASEFGVGLRSQTNLLATSLQ